MKKSLLLPFLLILLSGSLFAQKVLTGKVTDTKGVPLIGVNILEKGSNFGTVTDFNGQYTLTLSNKSVVLVFSYIGYNTLEVAPGDKASLDVVLEEATRSLSGVEVVGTRSMSRSATETPVPIDIIPIQQVLNSTGQLDINQILQYVAPSFNSNKQSGADGADHIDPATLRGLGPDQTLVLVNGKRWHQSALINIYGSRGRGNTGTDLNTIPAASIERIEILRDGAAAQYGSDAIAGVINIVLKSVTNELSANVAAGQYITGYGSTLKNDTLKNGKYIPSANDGTMLNANMNYGFKVGPKGFVNVTADYLQKGKTQRPNNDQAFPGSNYRNKFGDASSSNSAIYLNSRFNLTEKTDLYVFGGYNLRKTDAFAWTRSTDDDRNVPKLYPNGFDPHIQSDITDYSISAGIHTTWGGWNTDINNTFGGNRFHYFVDGTANTSLWDKSPTKFDAGGFGLSTNVTGVHFSKGFKNVLSGFNLAFGTEYRIENYNIFAGEEASWKNYSPVITSNDTLYKPGGSQGFPGFQPSDKLNKQRSNLGVYADAELDITKSLLLTGAIRYENYSDFGGTFNGKLSGRFKASDNFAIRGSLSTGFRAPSLAQIYFRSTFTDVTAGKIVDKVIANNESELARKVGIPSLKQETSVNASLGFTAKPASGLSFTVDGYLVNIKDRIVLTGGFGDDDDAIGSILKSLNVGYAQFFTNAIDTRTLGVDIIGTYARMIGTKNRIQVTLAANLNSMKIDGEDLPRSAGTVKTTDKLKGKEDNYFSERDKAFLLASAPPAKVSLVFDWKRSRFNANLRFTYFAQVDIINWRGVPGLDSYADDLLTQKKYQQWRDYVTDVYKARVTTDLTLGYQFSRNVSLNVGAANLLDVYPTVHDPGWTETGGMWEAVQMGFGGAYFFGRLAIKL